MKNLKKAVAFVLAALLLMSFTGCGNGNNTNNTRTVVDITGAEIAIPEKVEKIINLNPFGCQIMLGIGLKDYLVGISQDTFETEWLEVMCPESKTIPTYSDETAAEALLAANADVVFSQDPDVAADLRSKGVCCITFAYLTLDDYKFNMNLLGEILGGDAKVKTDRYLDYLNGKITNVQETISSKTIEKETMHYINANGDKGFYKTSGKDSTTDYCAKLCGIELAAAALIDFPTSKVDAEALLATNPDNVIIGGKYQHVIYDELLQAEEWKNISAVKNENVYKIPMGFAAWDRYSLETALFIPWMASVIYPEHYQFDAVKEIRDFYKTFMGYELTEEQAQYMIAGLTPNGEKEIASR